MNKKIDYGNPYDPYDAVWKDEDRFNNAMFDIGDSFDANENDERIYVCSYCKFPVDHQGEPLDMDNDQAEEYLKVHKNTYTVPVDGWCCRDDEEQEQDDASD